MLKNKSYVGTRKGIKCLVCWFPRLCIDNNRLRVNQSSFSKLKFCASQQCLSGAIALVGYQAFFPARFWPMCQARSLIYSRWNGPSDSKMKAFLVLCYGYFSLATILKPSSQD